MLQSVGSQRVGHDWVAELNWAAISLPGGVPDPGIEPRSPASPASAGGFSTTEPPGSSRVCVRGSVGRASDLI